MSAIFQRSIRGGCYNSVSSILNSIKIVYGGEDNAFEFRLVADGQYEIHGYRRREKPVKPIEFDIPK